MHAVSRRAYYRSGGIELPAHDRKAREDHLAFWSDVITADRNRVWILEGVAGCVGFLAAGPPVHADLIGAPLVELIGLYLLPEVWGRRMADVLHGRFTGLLQASAKPGVLDVWSGNSRALAFYRRHGWAPDGRDRPGPGNQPYIGLRLPAPSLRS